MEKVNNVFKMAYLMLSTLQNKNRFIKENELKEILNKELNESKNMKQQKLIKISNDIIDINFDNCVKILLKYNLIEYKIIDGIRTFKINKVGEYVYKNFGEEY